MYNRLLQQYIHHSFSLHCIHCTCCFFCTKSNHFPLNLPRKKGCLYNRYHNNHQLQKVCICHYYHHPLLHPRHHFHHPFSFYHACHLHRHLHIFSFYHRHLRIFSFYHPRHHLHHPFSFYHACHRHLHIFSFYHACHLHR